MYLAKDDGAMKRWVAFLIWVVGTLVAIAAIGENLYLGLVIGILSGVVFGVVCFVGFERRQGENRTPIDAEERGEDLAG